MHCSNSFKWMWSCRLLRSSLRRKCVGWGQEGAQDRGTDVRCIVTVCVDGRGPGAAFVSPAFKSTRSTFSCLVPPLPSTPPPPPSSLLTAREMCIYVCVCGLGLPWPEGEGSSSPLCSPSSSSLTGDCWRSQLACSWPIRSIWYRRRKKKKPG